MARKIAKLALLFNLIICCNCLNCEQYQSASIEDIPFREISWKELKDCLPLIGRAALDKDGAENIWRLVKEFHGGLENIPVSVYRNMGWILSGIPVEDLYNITMDEVGVIEAFGMYHGLSNQQMSIIASKVKDEWANKTPARYSQYDLKALNQILCQFNVSEILSIHADAYKNAADVIGNLRDCPAEVIKAFSKLAVAPNAFGSPAKWSKIDVSSIGVVITGLSPQDYALIPQDYLSVNQKFSSKSENEMH